jgi:5-hydroxyisourate hydrolase
MGHLTTHVLDTSTGRPAEGIRVELFGLSESRQLVRKDITNADGRIDTPMLDGGDMVGGEYELVFYAGDYFANIIDDSNIFLNEVVIRFVISEPDSHYHVPLLLSPYGYTTYRGS